MGGSLDPALSPLGDCSATSSVHLFKSFVKRGGWHSSPADAPGATCHHFCVVYPGLLVHLRLLPVGWQVIPLQETWEERQWAIIATWLDRVISPLGQAECTLLAQSGLAGMPPVQLCQVRRWHYLLRFHFYLKGPQESMVSPQSLI
jgi:hypothetical protein